MPAFASAEKIIEDYAEPLTGRVDRIRDALLCVRAGLSSAAISATTGLSLDAVDLIHELWELNLISTRELDANTGTVVEVRKFLIGEQTPNEALIMGYADNSLGSDPEPQSPEPRRV